MDAIPTETCVAPEDAPRDFCYYFSPNEQRGGGVHCQTLFHFVLVSLFSRPRTSGIGHRVKSVFRVGNKYAE